MDVVKLQDPGEWLERAAPVLLADEARHNLILGIAGTLRDRPGLYPEQELWLVEDGGRAVTAALQTPPWRLVLAGMEVAPLVEAIDRELPGVVASVDEAHAFAAAWHARTGAAIRPGRDQGIYALERVIPPRPAPGRSRPADDGDRQLIEHWLHGFAVEALGEEEPNRANLERMVEQRLAADERSGYALWEVDAEPVSLTGFGSETPNGSRIGPVYTPPEHRGRGYASALVAEVSQARLDAGRRFCFLYTDLANPTSNKIYAAIGYERVGDSVEIDFV